MKPLSIDVIPAAPGFFTVYDDEESKTIDVGEPVIAWRIETHEINHKDDVFSSCIAITVVGDAVSNCIGVQNPDMTISVFEHYTYESLKELIKDRYPN